VIFVQAVNSKLESRKLAVESSVRSGRLCRVKERFLIPGMTDDDASPGFFYYDDITLIVKINVIIAVDLTITI
jgi:hypothetical protein